LVSSFWITFDTRVVFPITRCVRPAEKWKSQTQNHIYTSVGRLFDFSKNCQFQVFEKKNQNQRTGQFWYSETSKLKRPLVLGISNPSKNHQFSWKNSWFFLSSLTFKKNSSLERRAGIKICFLPSWFRGKCFHKLNSLTIYICICNQSKNWQWIKRTTQHRSIIYTA